LNRNILINIYYKKQMKRERKTLCVLFLCGYYFAAVNAQEAISSAGGNGTGSGGSISYTTGQVAYSTFSGTTGSVAQGVQQVYLTSVMQDISLTTNWNIISFAVEPENMSMLSILNPLISSGTLVKVQDEKGNAIEKLPAPIGWVDNIGQMAVSEGYKIKVTGNATLSATGQQVTLPYNISLVTGWNIMGYPSMSSQPSMAAFDPLISAGSLLKVQDEQGNAIEQLPAPIGWIDNIHNLTPGDGYKVKTNINTSITINNAGKGEYQNAEAVTTQPAHFTLTYTGNGLDHMNIYIQNPTEGGVVLKAGDEIGVFDNDRCVGAATVEDPNLEYLMVTASSDDPLTPQADGFNEGGRFELRLWDNQTGSEIKTREVKIVKGYNNLFEKLGTSVLTVDFEKELLNVLGDAFPNPSSNKTTFTFQLADDCKVRLEIYNVMGELVRVLVNQNIPQGSHTIEWDNMSADGSKVKAGIYFYRLRLNDFSQIKSLVIK
jgi:hypothetical protein